MQLDLLQGGLFPELQETKLSPKKSKAVKKSAPAQASLDIVEKKPAVPASSPVAAVTAKIHRDEVGGNEKVSPSDEIQTKPEKNPGAFKTISEAAKSLGVPQHVLRFWESRFAQIKPLKLAGGRRYYRPDDMEILTTIKHLLYKQGYTINGAKKAFGARKKIDTVSAPSSPDTKKPMLGKKQINQLAGLRQELVGLRETLSELL